MEVLSVRNISKSIKNRQIINKISFDISKGQIVGLLGPNGAGKTTTFYSILGLVGIDNGEIYINEKDVTRMPSYKRAEAGISYLPQEPSIFRNLSVKSNILGVAEKNFSKKDDLKNFYQNILIDFGLEQIENSMGFVLSGGQRRKVEIARCLASKPKLILLDEPFAGIDPLAVNDLKKLILKLSSDGVGILITDHNVRETLLITNKSYVLSEGKILANGSSSELADNPIVKKYYLGDNFKL